MKLCQISFGTALPVALLSLAGCGGVERPAAPDLKLKPGLYKVEAIGKPRGGWHDAIMVSESQSDTVLKNTLPMFQERMKPSDGAPSWEASDRPCTVESFDAKGGTFTGKGNCRIISKGKTTNFTYSGTAYGDAFRIVVEITGFGTKTEGVPDTVEINGRL